MQSRTAITINASPEVVYTVWRDFERLPAFMYHLESVSTTTGVRSHWVARGPAGTSVEWDAEITEDVPGERIAWCSLEGASVDNTGSVQFRPAPGEQGTEVHLELQYSPPGGRLGSVVAKLFGEEPNQQVSDDLRRFKQIVETGEIARSDASPLGSRNRNQVHQHDAHPLDDDEAAAAAQEVRA
ncbi:MAG: SRPBCC family protein [Actinomycetota bacterium]|jgi:uncharacterized membrane protein|nr:SRPBCC family protein [Actinomycetota bacterium]